MDNEHRRGGGGVAALFSVCPATTRKGTPCTQGVEGAQTYCHHHDPERARERSRSASRAAKAKSNPLARALHKQLVKLAEDVASGALAPYKAAVIVQALNTRIRLVEVERRVQEQDDLLERLEQLERGRGGAPPWRA
jgi:hypothetical protein